MTPLIVDTDTVDDDVFSLLLALLDPRAKLEAITIVSSPISTPRGSSS